MKNRLLGVKASAGSGKTFRLANRYISLLNLDNPVNIVAITFTNKAANEMKERVIKFLNELGNDKNVVNMICDELNISSNELLRRKNKLIYKFLTNDINITTIDSFINKILRKFSFFAGVKSRFEVGEIDKNLIFKKFLKELNTNDFLKLVQLAKEEEKFSGILDLFESLYEKDKELKDIHFSIIKKPNDEKAKNDFNRLKEFLLESDLQDKAKKTIDIDFYKIPNASWFKKDSFNYWSFKKFYQDWFDEVLNELKLFFKEYYRYQESLFFTNLFYFYEKYKVIKWQVKKDDNKLDFKDIEHLVYELLQETLNKDFLYFRLDSKLNHILMDEFQDTSVTQWEIFEPIVDEIASGTGRKENRSFFYVGDTKQAIYRFRGGKKELFDYIASKYEKNGLVIEPLDTNFRSDKRIVEFVNKKFDLNEKVKSEEEGYLEIDDITPENAFDKIYEKIEFLNSNGVEDRDIAILVNQNRDILELAEFLENRGRKVVTAKKAEVISQPFAMAIISLMKYLYDNEQKIEKLNFLSFIGEQWSEKNIDIKIERPILMIKKIMDKYELVDESTLKLLEHSKKYDTLDDFVNEIDSYSEELPYKEFEGVTIITIHKSKGLEFPHVIVVDKLGDGNNRKPNIIFDYEDVKLKNLKLRKEKRDIIDNEYKKVLEKEKDLEIEDKKNQEYVAFTRAEHSLIILKRSDTTSKGGSKSGFITDLENVETGGTIKKSKTTQNNETESIRLNIKNYGQQELKIEEEEYKANDYEAIYLGNAIHYAFECDDVEAVKNIYGDFCDIKRVEELYKSAKKQLKNGQKEVPFIYDKKVGRIDLLIENEDNFEIIDYKSTRPNDEKSYIKQVRKYIEVVKTLTNKKVSGYLFYVDEGKFEEVK